MSTDGTPQTVVIGVPGQNADVAFDGAAGQRISVAVSDSTFGSGNVQISLLTPGGNTLVNPSTVGASAFIDTVALAASGTYTLLIDPRDSAVGQLTVRIYTVAQVPPSETAINGPAATTSTTTPGQDSSVEFSADQDQNLSVRIADSTFGSGGAKVSLQAPDGSRTAGPDILGTVPLVWNFVAPISGIYTVVLDPVGPATGSATVEVSDTPFDAGVTDVVLAAATDGGPVVAVTALPGQNALIRFSGHGGQRIAVSVRGATYPDPGIRVSLIAPDGSVAVSPTPVGAAGLYLPPVTLASDGTYTVLLDPQSNATGRATVDVRTVPADIVAVVDPGGSAASLGPTRPGQRIVATIPALAGQPISMTLSTDSTTIDPASVVLQAPDGTTVWQADVYPSAGYFVDLGAGYFVGPVTPTGTGDYHLVVDDPTLAASVRVHLQVFNVPADAEATAEIGGPTTAVTSTAPGQNLVVRFSAAANQKLMASITAPGIDDTYAATLYGPDGSELESMTGYLGLIGAIGPVAGAVAGEYRLVIDPLTAGYGAVRVQILGVDDPQPADAGTDGHRVALTVTAPGQVARASFNATSGQRISIVAADPSFEVADQAAAYQLTLTGPDGSVLDAERVTSTDPWLVGPVVLPANGTFSIAVDPDDISTGSVSLSVFLVPADAQLATAVDAGPVAVHLNVPGAGAVLTFGAPAGQHVYVSMDSGPGPVDVSVVDTGGAEQCAGEVSKHDSVDCLIEADGNYRVLVTTGLTTGTWYLQLTDGIGVPDVESDSPDDPEAWSGAAEHDAWWSVPAIEPIAGYAVVIDDQPGTVPGTTVTQTDKFTHLDLSDGVHYLHVRAIAENGAAGPAAHRAFRVDTAAPALTNLTSPTHPDPELGYPSADYQVTWTGTDPYSGVAGYSVSVTRLSTDVGLAVVNTTDSSFSGHLDGEGEWYVHVRALDTAGNWGDTVSVKLTVDGGLAVPVISSSTQPQQGTAYTAPHFVASWPADAEHAVGWSVVLDHTEGTVPPTSVTTTEPKFAADLAPDSWWLHVRAEDAGGKWSVTASFHVVITSGDVYFTGPLRGQSVWSVATLSTRCPTGLTVRYTAAAPGDPSSVTLGSATTDETGYCVLNWDTTTTAGPQPQWPDGSYVLQATGGDGTVLAETTVTVANALSAAERLQADYDAGRLNLDDFVYYSVLLGVSAPGVPAAYVDGAPAGTLPAVDDLLTRYGAGLSQAGLQRIKELFTPTSGGNALRVQPHSTGQWCGSTTTWLAIPYDCHVATAHFDIYWRSADHGMNNASGGLPDHIQELVNAIEAANTAYVDLGFPAIAKRVAIHLSPLQPDCSGVSLPEVTFLGLLILPEYTDIDNDPGWNCGDDGNTYLIRHELFHHVQYQYRIDQFTNSWWMEGSAEWGAHMAQIAPGAPPKASGLYAARLSAYLAHPEQAFTADWASFKDDAQYGSFILAEYLAENFGESAAIINVWERIDHRATPTQAIVEFIHAQGSDLDTEVAKYRRWLYVLQSNDLGDGFTDPDARGQWQQSAGSPPGRPGGWVKPQQVTLGRNLTNASGVVNLQGTGAAYIELNITYMHVGLLDVTVVGPDMSAWIMQYGTFPNGCWADNDQLSFNQNNGASAQLLILPICTRITLMIVNVNPASDKRYLPANWSIVYYPLTSIVNNGQVEIGASPYGAVFGDYASLRLFGKHDSDMLWFGAGDTWGISSDGQPPAVLDDYMHPFGLSVRDFFTVGNAVTSVVDAPGGLRVTHVFSPSGDSHLFNVLVAVTNEGQHQLTSVRYRKTVMFLPPDLSRPSHGRNAYTTFAKIGGNTNYIAGSTDEVDPYPYQPLASSGGVLGWFVDAGPVATGVTMDISIGDLAPGQSRTFNLYYGVTTDEASAIAAATAVGAQAYALGEYPTDAGRDAGTPYTGVFAIDGRDLTG